MTAQPNEACCVYIFVEDDGDRDNDASASPDGACAIPAIGGDDIREWLGIVGAVESVKLQYDATSKRSCFRVQFQHQSAALQSWEHLDGVKFKNCLIRIESRAFQRPSQGSEPSPVARQESSATDTWRHSAGLPHNHLLPVGLRMDVELADLLATDRNAATEDDELIAGAGALRAKQQELSDILVEIESTKRQIAEVDTGIVALRTAPAASEAHGGTTTAEVAGDGAEAASSRCAERQAASPSLRHTCVRNTTPISCTHCPPARLISHVSECFGPLSWCHCLVNATGQEEETVHVSIAFMMAEDCAAFLEAVGAEPQEGGRKAKRSRPDSDSDQSRELASIVAAMSSAQWVTQ